MSEGSFREGAELPLESPLVQKKEAQITVRLPSAIRDAIVYFSRGAGGRKGIGGLIEEILAKGIEDLAQEKRVALIELRAKLRDGTHLKRLIPLRLDLGPTSEEEEILWKRLEREGIDPSSISPGLYVMDTELDDHLLKVFVSLGSNKKGGNTGYVSIDKAG